MKQIICDRCRKIINYSQGMPLFAITRTNTSEYMDMCKTCREDFVKFMHGEPKLSDKQIDKIVDLLETEWGYEGIREDVLKILKEADNE